MKLQNEGIDDENHERRRYSRSRDSQPYLNGEGPFYGKQPDSNRTTPQRSKAGSRRRRGLSAGPGNIPPLAIGGEYHHKGGLLDGDLLSMLVMQGVMLEHQIDLIG